MAYKVLFVDDESNILDGFRRQLRGEFEFETAVGGKAGLEVLRGSGPFAVVVSDMRMPEIDGVQFLGRVREQSPNTVRLMLTGNNDLDTAVRAVNEGGIFRFLCKPCSKEDLTKAVRDAIRQYQLITAEKELIEKTLRGSIKVLTDILGLVDPAGFGRSQTLKQLVQKVAGKILSEDAVEVELAALLSGIGSVILPSTLSKKISQGEILSKDEEAIAARVPEVGRDLLANIPRLEKVAEIVRYQNKRFDGSGYPKDEIKAELIPAGARLIKIFKDLIQLESIGNSRTVALSRLAERSDWYDKYMLRSVSELLSTPNSSEAVSGSSVYEVAVRELVVGQILLSDVVTTQGTLLITAGHAVTATVLERLNNYAKLVGLKEPIRVDTRMPTVPKS